MERNEWGIWRQRRVFVKINVPGEPHRIIGGGLPRLAPALETLRDMDVCWYYTAYSIAGSGMHNTAWPSQQQLSTCKFTAVQRRLSFKRLWVLTRLITRLFGLFAGIVSYSLADDVQFSFSPMVGISQFRFHLLCSLLFPAIVSYVCMYRVAQNKWHNLFVPLNFIKY